MMRELPEDGATPLRAPTGPASLTPQARGVAPLPTPRRAQRWKADPASKTARGQLHRGVAAQFSCGRKDAVRAERSRRLWRYRPGFLRLVVPAALGGAGCVMIGNSPCGGVGRAGKSSKPTASRPAAIECRRSPSSSV